MFPTFKGSFLFGLVLCLAVGSSLCDLDIKTVLEQPLVTPGPNVVATSLVLTFTAGDEGAPPHHHSGPVIGYVLEGEFLFQVRDFLEIQLTLLILSQWNVVGSQRTPSYHTSWRNFL